MQFAVSFIEYLVIGCFATLCIAIGFNDDPIELFKTISGKAALLIPFVYVLGMFFDFVAYHTVRKSKSSIEKFLPSKEQKASDDKSKVADEFGLPSATAFVCFKSDALSRQVEIRSSRDRIARGVVLVLLILFLQSLFFSKGIAASFSATSQCSVSVITFVAFVLGYLTWWRFDNLSKRFKRKAVEVILMPNNPNENSKPAA